MSPWHAVRHLAIVVAIFVTGILIHECGHGAIAVAFGARITHLNVLGVQLWPTLRWDFEPGYWGRGGWNGRLTPRQREWVHLGGNLATLLVSVLALLAFLRTSSPAFSHLRTVLLALVLFFLDTLSHTLPTLGLPMYLFFGRRDPASVSEGYLAATRLGCPGWLFQGAVIGYTVLAVVGIVYVLAIRGRQTVEPVDS